MNAVATVEFDVIINRTAKGTYRNHGYVGVDPASQAGVVVYSNAVADANDLDGDGDRTERSRQPAHALCPTHLSLESFKSG